jgi:nucleoside-diphosphate-sugar epimerase
MMVQSKICITGARGFIGRALERCLRERGDMPILANRSPIGSGDEIDFQDLLNPLLCDTILRGCSVIVHLAARVHVMDEAHKNPMALYRKDNVEATLTLARNAANVGVRRFIFLSSVKVNGEQTFAGYKFSEDQMPSPADPYGISKLEAEEGLKLLSKETDMEVVIIRPPLVYGPGVKANFLALMRLLQRGYPLPFGALKANNRSLVFLDNLVSLIIVCLNNPAAANQAFFVSDGDDLSTAVLIKRLSLALGRPARLIYVPEWLIKFGANLIGKSDVADRLCGSLQVDINKAKKLLGWTPPIGIDAGLQITAEHWLNSRLSAAKQITKRFL